MFCTRARSCACADDAKFVRSRNAQCKTRESPILVPRGRAPFGQHQEITTSGLVQHRKSTIHGLPATLRMLRVKSDKSDWFWFQSIVFTKPFKNRMSLDRPLDQARGSARGERS